MPVNVVSVSSGSAPLGRWGRLELTGAASAVIRSTRTEDIEVPSEVAVDLVYGPLLLNDELGRLLCLPYDGDVVMAYDLETGETAYPPLTLPRAGDRGLRTASVRVVPHFGVVYLTEATLAAFSETLDVAWRRDEDFSGWAIDRITQEQVHLALSDWSGNTSRQSRSLATGDGEG